MNIKIPQSINKQDYQEIRRLLAIPQNDRSDFIIQVPNLQAPDGQLHMYNDITHMVGYIERSLQQLFITVSFQN